MHVKLPKKKNIHALARKNSFKGNVSKKIHVARNLPNPHITFLIDRPYVA